MVEEYYIMKYNIFSNYSWIIILETKSAIIENCIFAKTYSLDDVLSDYGAAITITDYSPLVNTGDSSITGEIKVIITNCQFVYSNPQVFQTFPNSYGTADGAIVFTLALDGLFLF